MHPVKVLNNKMLNLNFELHIWYKCDSDMVVYGTEL